MSTLRERLIQAEKLSLRTVPRINDPIPAIIERSTPKEDAMELVRSLFNKYTLPIFEEFAAVKGISLKQNPYKRKNLASVLGGVKYIIPQQSGFDVNENISGELIEGRLIWDITATTINLVRSASFRSLTLITKNNGVLLHNWHDPRVSTGLKELIDEVVKVMSLNGEWGYESSRMIQKTELRDSDPFDPGPP